MKCFVFWTAGKSRVSRLIQKITRIPGRSLEETPSHAGMIFLDSPGDVVFEAHSSTGGWCQRSLDNLTDECASRGRQAWTVLVADHEDVVTELYSRCRMHLGIWSYNHKQLPMMAILQRMNGMTRSPGKVVCSEAVSRILVVKGYNFPAWAEKQPYAHDAISPALLMEHFPAPVLKGWPAD